MVSDMNEITAVIASVFIILVMRGLWPSLRAPANVAVEHLSRGMFATGLAIVTRFAYWDFFFEGVRRVDPALMGDLRAVGAYVNGFANLLLVVGAIYVLRALLARVPAAERRNWNIFTVAFYPDGFGLFRRGRK